MVEIAPVIERRLGDERFILRLFLHHRPGEHIENASSPQRFEIDGEHRRVVRRQPRQRRFHGHQPARSLHHHDGLVAPDAEAGLRVA